MSRSARSSFDHVEAQRASRDETRKRDSTVAGAVFTGCTTPLHPLGTVPAEPWVHDMATSALSYASTAVGAGTETPFPPSVVVDVPPAYGAPNRHGTSSFAAFGVPLKPGNHDAVDICQYAQLAR